MDARGNVAGGTTGSREGRGVRWWGALAGVAVLVGACAGPGPTRSTLSSPIPTPTTVVAATPAALGAGREERLFGKVAAIDWAGRAVTLDLQQWFDDIDAANAAARQDGVIPAGQTLPEPFYVRDLRERLTVPLGPSVAVVVLGYDAEGNIEPRPVSLVEFAFGWQTGPPSNEWTPAVYYWCSTSNGVVTRMEAQYVP